MIDELCRAIGETLQRRWHAVWTQEDYEALQATLAGMETFINAFEESERRRELAEADNAELLAELRDRGEHSVRCIDRRLRDVPCTCGLDAILTAKHPGAQVAVVVEAARELVAVWDEQDAQWEVSKSSVDPERGKAQQKIIAEAITANHKREAFVLAVKALDASAAEDQQGC